MGYRLDSFRLVSWAKNKKILTSAALSLATLTGIAFLGTPLVSAGTLTSFTVTPSTATVDAMATYTFSFTNATTIPADPGTVFIVQFPDDYDVRDTTATVKVNGATQTVTSDDGQQYRHIKISSSVNAGSSVQIIFPNIQNPGNIGTQVFTSIETQDGSGNTLDIPASNPQVTYTMPGVSFGGGSGTSGDPYQITNCTMLQGMYTHLNSNYKLMNDIDCTDTASWNSGKGFNPVGSDGAPFTGSLNGNGHTISDLSIIRADENAGYTNGADEYYVGLFGAINGATLTDVQVINSKVKGFHEVGGLVGYMISGTISGSSFNKTTSDNSCAPGHCVWARYGEDGGGLVGLMDSGTITHSKSAGPVKGSGNVIGGLIGKMNGGTLEYSTSGSNTDGGSKIGGAVGWLHDGHILGVATTGSTDANTDEDFKSGQYTGGIAGLMDDGTIEKSLANGDIHADTGHAGGLVGEMGAGTIDNTYATGIVTTNEIAGGLVGFFISGTINRSYSTGDVNTTGHIAGGLIGYIDGTVAETVSNSFTRSAATSPNAAGAFIGYINNDSQLTLTRNYYDTSVSNSQDCVGGTFSTPTNPTGCSSVNGAAQPNYFQTASNAPFTQSGSAVWSTSDWLFSSGYMPLLLATPPFMVCEAPSATATTAHAHCYDFPHGGWGTTTWEARYKLTSGGSYTNVNLSNINEGEATISGLASNTDYNVEFRFTNDYGTSEWGTVQITTDIGQDGDNDGIADGVENAGPNSGDANNDGTPDSQQANVISFVSSVSNKYVVVELSNGCTLTDNAVRTEAQLASQDSGYNYPNGLVHFTANCGTNGFTTSVKIYYYDVSSNGLALRKFNSRTNAFANIAGANLSQASIAGKTVSIASYQVTDGGALDEDGQANGIIVDPSGLAVVDPTNGAGNQLANTGQSLQAPLFATAALLIGLTIATTRPKFIRK